MPLFKILKQALLIALGVLIASSIAPGIKYESPDALVLVVVLLTAFNLILRPLLILFALPFVILTFGLGILLINALLFYLVSELVEGFTVTNFWWALLGAFIVSLTNLGASLLLGSQKGAFRFDVKINQRPPKGGAGDGSKKKSLRDDDVIDV